MPWQQHVDDVGLEYDSTGRFAYDEVVVTVMRQSGKTTWIFTRKTWRLTMAPRLLKPDGSQWGPQRGMYTAQTRQAARKKLEKDFSPALRTTVAKRSFKEIRNPKGRPSRPSEWKESLNNGSEHLLFGARNYLQIDAPTRAAGHGDTLDDGDIDEAFAHANDDVEGAMSPAMLTRWNSQLNISSTAGDAKSRYFYGKVVAGRADIERMTVAAAAGVAVEPSRTAYFEWSIPDDADIDDEDVWWEFMPALGRTIPIEKVRSELTKNRRNPKQGEDLWRRSMGNQWVQIPVLESEGPPAKIPAEKWKATSVCRCEVAPCEHTVAVPVGELTIGFSVSRDGEWASIGIASGTMSSPYVEVIDHFKSVGWLPDRLVELVQNERPIKIGCNAGSPAAAQVGAILEAFAEAGIRAANLHQLNATEYRNACGGFFTDVVEVRLRHPGAGQGPLDNAVAAAGERSLQGGFAWRINDATVPVSPLEAVTVARALLPMEKTKDPAKPRRVHSW